MPKPIPDISDRGGLIRQSVDLDKFEALARTLEVDPIKIPGFARQVNQEIHELLTQIERLKTRKIAKKRKQDIDFPTEIEKAAQHFHELVSKAPLAICNDQRLDDLARGLSNVPNILADLRNNPDLANLGMNDPYGGKVTDFRIDFVRGIHALYDHFSGKQDWVTSNDYDDKNRYTNPFFGLLKFCYDVAKLGLTDSAIRSDIEKAMKAKVIQD